MAKGRAMVATLLQTHLQCALAVSAFRASVVVSPVEVPMRIVAVAAVLSLAVAPALAAEPDGKALYEAKCAMCHGKDGVAKPLAKGSGNFNDAAWQKANSAEAIEKVTTEGKGKMKGYAGKLTAEEIKAIAAHVKTLG